MNLTCNHCLGTGKEPDSPEVDCLVCGGTGEIVACFYGGTLAKLDAIIAEQASIRDDLTTAIAAIWNKVKDL